MAEFQSHTEALKTFGEIFGSLQKVLQYGETEIWEAALHIFVLMAYIQKIVMIRIMILQVLLLQK
jgi:hypothetical protein